jgi:hypothetical protein
MACAIPWPRGITVLLSVYDVEMGRRSWLKPLGSGMLPRSLAIASSRDENPKVLGAAMIVQAILILIGNYQSFRMILLT